MVRNRSVRATQMGSTIPLFVGVFFPWRTINDNKEGVR